MTELFQSTTSRENLHNRDLNVVDRSLEQRRKATIQEGVKKFHLCLCLVTNTSVPVSVFVVASRAHPIRQNSLLFDCRLEPVVQ